MYWSSCGADAAVLEPAGGAFQDDHIGAEDDAVDGSGCYALLEGDVADLVDDESAVTARLGKFGGYAVVAVLRFAGGQPIRMRWGIRAGGLAARDREGEANPKVLLVGPRCVARLVGEAGGSICDAGFFFRAGVLLDLADRFVAHQATSSFVSEGDAERSVVVGEVAFQTSSCKAKGRPSRVTCVLSTLGRPFQR
jgi:hypothetical protein